MLKAITWATGLFILKKNPKTKSLIESLASAKTNAQTELASTKQFIKTGSQLIAPPEPALNEKPVTQKQNQKQPQQSVTEAPPEPMETILTDSSIDSDRITESPSEVLNTLLTSETDSNQGNESLSDNLSTNILGLSDADLGADVEPLNVDESGIESEADFFSADTNLTETDTLFASETGLEEVRPIIPESGQASANPLSGINWQAILPPIDGDLAKPLAGVVILMVGLGLFIRRKMSQIKEGRQQHSASALNNQRYNRRQSTRLSFNALAQSHRNQSLDPSEMPTNMPAPEAKPLFTPNDHPKKANKWATKPQPKKPSKNPVGLGALLNAIPDKPFVERPQLQPKPAKSKAAQPKPLNKRQVVNQYQQQQNMAKKPVGAKPVPKKPAVQKQPNTINPVQVARKTASKKLDSIKSQRSPQRQAQSLTGGNANEPIPGNPQVLDFLKNVADYMERDGNSQRAQSIQKNLRNYQ